MFRDGKFTIDVTGKVKEISDEFPIKFEDDKSKKVTTPASADMFDMVDSEHLDTKKRELFHCSMEQNLFVSKRDRQYMQPIIAVLYAQVQKLTGKDWSGLIHCVKWSYERRKDMMMFDASKGLNTFEWHINASFALHLDF